MYATTSYIHPHILSSVCIKRRHRTQVFKMSETKLCVICNEGSTQPSKKLINSSEMITDLVKCCNERLSLGELEIKQLCDRLNSLSETEKSSVYYHSECRKPLVNNGDPGSILGRVDVFVSLSKRHLLPKSTGNTQE